MKHTAIRYVFIGQPNVVIFSPQTCFTYEQFIRAVFCILYLKQKKNGTSLVVAIRLPYSS